MMEEQNNDVEKVSWNLSQALIFEISNMLKLSSTNYILMNFEKSFTALKCVKMRIIANLNEDEIMEFVTLEKNCKIGLIKQKVTKFKESNQFGCPYTEDDFNAAKNIKVNLVDAIDEYNEKIMIALKKYGFLIPAKKDSTQMGA